LIRQIGIGARDVPPNSARQVCWNESTRRPRCRTFDVGEGGLSSCPRRRCCSRGPSDVRGTAEDESSESR
jgi:hypothetical protein